jgi:two-component system, chemotaxis family, protein-glutamate methylesterase/glutaminase
MALTLPTPFSQKGYRVTAEHKAPGRSDDARSYAAFDLVVMACSLGGFRALTSVLSSLPSNFPAAVVVVQHMSPKFPSEYAQMLDSRVSLPVSWAQDHGKARRGVVYIAPPDRHVLVGPGGRLGLLQAPKVQFARPSADVLFGSAALQYKARALGVVLTGRGSDGARGAQAIKQNGGFVISQDRATSTAYDMPEATVATGCADLVLPLENIAAALITLVMAPGAAPWFTSPAPAPVSISLAALTAPWSPYPAQN